MGANPFGRANAFSGTYPQKANPKVVELAKGDHLKLRYGVFIHTGDAKEGKVAEHYEKFVKLKN